MIHKETSETLSKWMGQHKSTTLDICDAWKLLDKLKQEGLFNDFLGCLRCEGGVDNILELTENEAAAAICNTIEGVLISKKILEWKVSDGTDDRRK